MVVCVYVMSVHMIVHVCMPRDVVSTHMCMYAWRREVNVGYLPPMRSTLGSEIGTPLNLELTDLAKQTGL